MSQQAQQKQQVELLLFLEFHSAFEVVQFLVALFFKILNNKILWGLLTQPHRCNTPAAFASGGESTRETTPAICLLVCVSITGPLHLLSMHITLRPSHATE